MPRYRKPKRPGYIACGKMVYSDASKALAIAKRLKNLVNVEIKTHDAQTTSDQITDAGEIFQMSNIAQDDTTITRDGSQCKMISYELNYILEQNASSTTATFVRILLVQDKQTNQAIFTIADLLEDETLTDHLVSSYNRDNKRRFNVLYDKLHVLSKGGNNGVAVKKKIYKNIMFRFDNAAAAITSLTQNSLALVAIGSEVTNDPSLTLFGRINFVDN